MSASTPATDKSQRAYLMILKEGPVYSVEDHVGPHCEVLGRRFNGELWTFGTFDADQDFGGFRLRVLKADESARRVAYLRYANEVKARARQLAQERPGQVVAISYDPFKNGLLANRVARITGGQSIIEVNGAYGSPDNLVDEPSSWKRTVRRRLMQLMGSYVLRRTHGIRLLFDTQLEGFARPHPRTVIRRFFDIANVDRFTNDGEEPRIVLVGFPFLRKGADVLFKAFVQIADRHPQWECVMIGHELKESLERAGMRHPRVKVLPGMPQKELVGWVARCAIMALPSRSEGLPRVLMEGGAAGKCRVASRVDGIPNVIEDGVDGLLVDKGDVGQLADALNRAMSDAGLRNALGAAARDRIRREFSVDAYIDRVDEMVGAVRAAWAR